VTELRLPALDVYGMLREARRTAPALRALVVTAHSTERAAIEALNFGIAGYLVKPVRTAEIVAAAARVLA
jgi:DNA-binding NarL/FixJ family response regulator